MESLGRKCLDQKVERQNVLLERCTSEESGLNIKDELGRTAFMWACCNGHKDVVQLLLDYSDSNIDLNEEMLVDGLHLCWLAVLDTKMLSDCSWTIQT